MSEYEPSPEELAAIAELREVIRRSIDLWDEHNHYTPTREIASLKCAFGGIAYVSSIMNLDLAGSVERLLNLDENK